MLTCSGAVMTEMFQPLDVKKIQTCSLAERKSMVSAGDFARAWKKGGRFADFLDRLPHVLAAGDLRAVAAAIVRACKDQRTVALGMGAHAIKVGLNPVLIDLMEKGIIRSVAMNGAGIVHDFELAFSGQTSEDVAASLGSGSFGMARETCSFLGEATDRAGKEEIGLGRAVGLSILEQNLPFAATSILAAGARLSIPVTVHVAIGTDIIHMHPQFHAGQAGEASHRDFLTFASVVSTLEQGVYINLGSAVILPEVFLKALSLVRNLGHSVKHMTTVNMDFIRHYRPMTNVVHRPTLEGGKGYCLVGHHEIMFPLLAAAVIEQMQEDVC